jgi:hypothetical protein
MELFRGAIITSGDRPIEMTYGEFFFDAPLDSLFPVDGEWSPWANLGASAVRLRPLLNRQPLAGTAP